MKHLKLKLEKMNKIIIDDLKKRLDFESSVKGDVPYLILQDLDWNLVRAKQNSTVWLNTLIKKKEELKVLDIEIERKIRLAKDIIYFKDTSYKDGILNQIDNIIFELRSLKDKSDIFIGEIISAYNTKNYEFAKHKARHWFLVLKDRNDLLSKKKKEIINKILNIPFLF